MKSFFLSVCLSVHPVFPSESSLWVYANILHILNSQKTTLVFISLRELCFVSQPLRSMMPLKRSSPRFLVTPWRRFIVSGKIKTWPRLSQQRMRTPSGSICASVRIWWVGTFTLCDACYWLCWLWLTAVYRLRVDYWTAHAMACGPRGHEGDHILFFMSQNSDSLNVVWTKPIPKKVGNLCKIFSKHEAINLIENRAKTTKGEYMLIWNVTLHASCVKTVGTGTVKGCKSWIMV